MELVQNIPKNRIVKISAHKIFFYGIVGKLADVSTDSQWLPQPMDIRNYRGVKRALPAFGACKGVGGGAWIQPSRILTLFRTSFM